MKKKGIKTVQKLWLIVLALTIIPFTGLQASIVSDLSITTSLTFDEEFAATSGSASQSGIMDTVSGVGQISTSFTGTTVTGPNPLNGNVTEIGPAFGFDASASAPENSGFGMGIDMQVNLQNNSATEAYTVTFKIDYVNAAMASGPDAYSESEFTLEEAFGDELFFTYVASDTLYGNYPVETEFGGTVIDIDSFFFNVTINPLDSIGLVGNWTLEGETTDGSVATADISVLLSVHTAPVPLPPAFILLGSGILGILTMRNRKR